MSDPYSQQLQLNSLFANDTTPGMSTIDILSSIKLLSNIQATAENGANPLSHVAREETKYLVAAMDALKKNKVLSDKFGSGFQGSMTLAGLLKQHHAKQVFEGTLAEVLTKTGKTYSKQYKNPDGTDGPNPFDFKDAILRNNGGKVIS